MTLFNPKLYERPGITEDKIYEIKEIYDLFSPDKNDNIDIRDIRSSLEALGFEQRNLAIYQLIDNLEREEKFSMNFEGFLDLMANKLNNANTKLEISKSFKMFDHEKKGKIDLKDLKILSKEIGENLSNEQLKNMINAADENGDGNIEFDEFYNILTKKIY